MHYLIVQVITKGLRYLVLIIIPLASCNHHPNSYTGSICPNSCMAQGKPGSLACTFTSPELRKRKETVIANLKTQVIEKKELEDGYAFKFAGNDKMVDQITEFMKSERQC